MPEKKAVKQDLSFVSYALGIVSIVMAIFQPLAGVILGIIGLIQSKKQTGDLSKRAKKLNIIGIVIGIVVFTISVIVGIYLATNEGMFSNFPIA